jgi:hypothetical protein
MTNTPSIIWVCAESHDAVLCHMRLRQCCSWDSAAGYKVESAVGGTQEQSAAPTQIFMLKLGIEPTTLAVELPHSSWSCFDLQTLLFFLWHIHPSAGVVLYRTS